LSPTREWVLRRAGGFWEGTFRAMASACQVLMEVDDRRKAHRILSVVASETWRIEAKFSRYLPDNVIHRINHGGGGDVEVDTETAGLLDYAARLYELSDRRFDITSGVLRRVWRFDGSGNVPPADAVEEIRRHVGWSRVGWDGHRIRLEPGMEIDLGGFGKEYAADRAAARAAECSEESCLINLGGDLVVTRPRRDGATWLVGVERPDAANLPVVARQIQLSAGALATSGDTKRFLVKDGVRYGHILDPTTGWPVRGAPRSVTVAAGTCLDAGMMATFAMLKGRDAEAFLQEEDVQHWIQR
jgi:thiamine biosynthesis lipoprotein